MFNIPSKITCVFLAVFAAVVFAVPTAKAANVGDVATFNVNPNYDATGRSTVPATLVDSTSSLYFYVETDFWNIQPSLRKEAIIANFNSASDEFSSHIYPTLTSLFGSEPRPSINGETKISILFEPITTGFGGYFRTNDGYSKLQVPDSNEQGILYLPASQVQNPQLKMFLAHEFTHLITFNQKDKINNVQEETWLNEARADYVSTLLGYDDAYEGSNLQGRVQDFLQQPNDSLAEWQNTKYDYAALNLFMHYLVDHYGVKILANSLHSKLIGIPSINEALAKNGVTENFGQIFTNWTIATTINNCAADARYCYTNKNLANVKISPNLIFLPLTGDSALSMNNTTKNWSGNWQKIIGGNGDLSLEFSSLAGLNFQVPYIIYDKNNNYTVKFLTIDSNGKGTIAIKNFGTSYNSLIIIPSLQTKLSGFVGTEPAYSYLLKISISGGTPPEDAAQTQVQKLLDQIEALKKQIAALQSGSSGNARCTVLNNNLYAGVSGTDVACLQQFLSSQGADIYPQALVTGFFGSLTRAAAVRFQAKYNILQTGFVGVVTRAKINNLLK